MSSVSQKFNFSWGDFFKAPEMEDVEISKNLKVDSSWDTDDSGKYLVITPMAYDGAMFGRVMRNGAVLRNIKLTSDATIVKLANNQFGLELKTHLNDKGEVAYKDLKELYSYTHDGRFIAMFKRDKTTGDLYLNDGSDDKEVTEAKHKALLAFSPIILTVHAIATAFTVTVLAAKILLFPFLPERCEKNGKLSLTWENYSFKNRCYGALHDIARITLAPLLLVGFALNPILGIINPYFGRHTYSRMERFQYKQSVIGYCFQPHKIGFARTNMPFSTKIFQFATLINKKDDDKKVSAALKEVDYKVALKVSEVETFKIGEYVLKAPNGKKTKKAITLDKTNIKKLTLENYEGLVKQVTNNQKFNLIIEGSEYLLDIKITRPPFYIRDKNSKLSETGASSYNTNGDKYTFTIKPLTN